MLYADVICHVIPISAIKAACTSSLENPNSNFHSAHRLPKTEV